MYVPGGMCCVVMTDTLCGYWTDHIAIAKLAKNAAKIITGETKNVNVWRVIHNISKEYDSTAG